MKVIFSVEFIIPDPDIIISIAILQSVKSSDWFGFWHLEEDPDYVPVLIIQKNGEKIVFKIFKKRFKKKLDQKKENIEMKEIAKCSFIEKKINEKANNKFCSFTLSHFLKVFNVCVSPFFSEVSWNLRI